MKCCCGSIVPDENAANKILKKGLSTAGHAGTWLLDSSVPCRPTAELADDRIPCSQNAWGEKTSTLDEEIQLEQVSSMNQESNGFSVA
jgi:putative transposase